MNSTLQFKKSNLSLFMILLVFAALLSFGCSEPNPPLLPPLITHYDPVSGRTWKSYGQILYDAEGEGKAANIGAKEIEVGKKTNLSFEYTAPPTGLHGGAYIALLIPSLDWGMPQTQDPWKPCFVKVRRSDGRQVNVLAVPGGFTITPSRTQTIILAKIRGAPLKPEGKVRFNLKGFQAQKIAGASPFEILVDSGGAGHFAAAPGKTAVKVLAAKAVYTRVRIPYRCKSGEMVKGMIVPLDRFGNLAGIFPQTYKIEAEGNANLAKQFVRADSKGMASFQLTAKQSGFAHVEVGSDWKIGGRSNPMMVDEDEPKWNIYVGDTHSHTSHSDAFIVCNQDSAYDYARHVSMLDFAAVTDHAEAIWGDPPSRWKWEKLTQAVKRANEPGRFAALAGFEWTSTFVNDQLYPVGPGHLTVLRPGNEAYPIRADAFPGADAKELIESMDQYGGQMYFHHPAADWGYADFDDPLVERTSVVEIFSTYGCSLNPECKPPINKPLKVGHTAESALARGHVLGFVASTDNHLGHPGASRFPGYEDLNLDAGGRTYVLAKELSREAILDAFANRRTYATNGADILMDFTADGAPMGSKLPVDAKPDFKAKAITQKPAEIIELVRYQQGDNVPFPVIAKESPVSTYLLELSYQPSDSRPALYYIHVREKDGGEAWSSPIFIGELPKKDFVDPELGDFTRLLQPKDRIGMSMTSMPKGDFVDIQNMPDTLDLVTRISIGLNHLVTNLDPTMGCIPYFSYDFTGTSALINHANWDYGDISGRYLEAIMSARNMTGMEIGKSREENLRRTLLATIGRDGLTYRMPSTFSDLEADIFDQGSTMSFLTEAYRRTKDGRWLDLLRSMCRRLLSLAEKTPHGLRFAYPTYLPDGKAGPARDNWDHADPCHHAGRLLDPLADYLALAKDSAAEQLFNGIAKFIVNDSGVFDRDGKFDGHVHSRTLTLLGLLKHAMARRDEKTIEFVRQAYNFLKTQGTNFGWFPEVIDPERPQNPGVQRAETDVTADMVSMAILFADKDPAFWDDIELFTRNHLAASQLLNPALLLEGRVDLDGKAARMALGSFCGHCEINGWGLTSQNCCSPAGIKAMARVWNAIVKHAKDTITVFLALNYADNLVTVKSDEPYEGKVEITPARITNILFRLPEGTEQNKVTIGGCRDAAFSGNFALIKDCKAGETAFINYPLIEKVEAQKILGSDYKLTWKGKTLLAVEPEGNGPLYKRIASGIPARSAKKYFILQ